METRRKDLKDFTMWNSADSSIKFFNLCDTIFSKILLIDRDFPIASSQIQGKRLSKLNNKFAVAFFNNKIGQYLSGDIQQSVSCYNPLIAVSFKEMVSCLFYGGRTRSAERFLKPMKKSDVCVGHFKNTSIMAVFIAISRFVLEFASMKTSFSINNTGKICEMKWFMLFRNVFNSMFMIDVIELHSTPFVQVH